MKLLVLLFCLITCAPSAAAQQSDTLAATAARDTALVQPAAGTALTDGAASTDGVVATDSAALTDEALWDRANTAYLRSDFRTAVRTYRQILERGAVSAKLYYNLGNACFKEGSLGEAILYYNKALRLAPGDEDIRYNLTVAESRTKDRIEAIPEFFLKGWMRSVRSLVSGDAWTILSLAALVFALSCTLLYLLSHTLALRKAGFYGTLCGLVLMLAATLFALGARREAIDRDRAVVMSSAVSVKSSPDKSATDLFVLHEGTTVKSGDTLGDWTEITIADGKKGWIESRHISTI